MVPKIIRSRLNISGILYIFILTNLFKPSHLQIIMIPPGGFIRDCNHPSITMHAGTNGHSYCNHACGYVSGTSDPSGSATVPICTPTGDCLCQCITGIPQAVLDPALCPSTQTMDPDPTALPMCQQRCAATCVGGTADICQESVTIMNNGLTAEAKICTCTCPQPCRAVTVPTTTTTTTTTTTPATAVVPAPAAASIAIIPFPIIKPIYFMWKSIKFYYLATTLLLGKLVLLYFLSLIANAIGTQIMRMMMFRYSRPIMHGFVRFFSDYLNRLIAPIISTVVNYVIRDFS